MKNAVLSVTVLLVLISAAPGLELRRVIRIQKLKKEIKYKDMKKIILLVVLGLASWAEATTINVGVTTDKWTYQPGESVKISVTAYNPNPQLQVLTGSWDLCSYSIDGVYNSADYPPIPGGGWGIGIRMSIAANDSHTWNFTYDSEEMQIYPLNPGWHSVIGKITADEFPGGLTGYSHWFYVNTPEPATVVMVGLGGMLLRGRRRKH